jgi:hypothetical protein
MAREIRTADATWLDLQKPGKFEEFFSAFLKLLHKKLQVIEVKGKVEYSYYSCCEIHDSRNPNWKPWRLLERYCERTGYDDLEARDMIIERIGRQVICECLILKDEKAIRRMELEKIFGVDFGVPGRRELDVI